MLAGHIKLTMNVICLLFCRVMSKMNKCHQITCSGQEPIFRSSNTWAFWRNDWPTDHPTIQPTARPSDRPPDWPPDQSQTDRPTNCPPNQTTFWPTTHPTYRPTIDWSIDRFILLFAHWFSLYLNRKGKIGAIEIKVEQRMGNKKVIGHNAGSVAYRFTNSLLGFHRYIAITLKRFGKQVHSHSEGHVIL